MTKSAQFNVQPPGMRVKCQEYVVWRDIAVDNMMLVEVFESCGYLKKNAGGERLGERFVAQEVMERHRHIVVDRDKPAAIFLIAEDVT